MKANNTMLKRVLEPEVMDSENEALDYDSMDHSEVNQRFADDFLKALGRGADQRIKLFDAGTGTAQIPIVLARTIPTLQILAADLAHEMLKVGQKNVDANRLSTQIELVLADCKALKYADGSFDGVISNSIVHHIPEPAGVLKELWRILKRGGILFVRDLMRPNSSAEVEHLVATYAGGANSHQQQLFRQSLEAALTVSEVRDLCHQLDIGPLQPPDGSLLATSDRHWTLMARK